MKEKIFETRILLCSASPRRQQLLKESGFDFEVIKKDVDESFPSSLLGSDIATYLAEKKSDAFKNEMGDENIFITADTIVWRQNRVLGKPIDEREAINTLKLLSGNRHEVFTGVCISTLSKRRTFSVCSEVVFKKISDAQIQYYLEHYKPYDKAGSYGAQECLAEGMNPCSEKEKIFMKQIGKDLFGLTKSNRNDARVNFIDRIEGSYFNVMGLPVAELYDELNLF